MLHTGWSPLHRDLRYRQELHANAVRRRLFGVGPLPSGLCLRTGGVKSLLGIIVERPAARMPGTKMAAKEQCCKLKLGNEIFRSGRAADKKLSIRRICEVGKRHSQISHYKLMSSKPFEQTRTARTQTRLPLRTQQEKQSVICLVRLAGIEEIVSGGYHSQPLRGTAPCQSLDVGYCNSQVSVATDQSSGL